MASRIQYLSGVKSNMMEMLSMLHHPHPVMHTIIGSVGGNTMANYFWIRSLHFSAWHVEIFLFVCGLNILSPSACNLRYHLGSHQKIIDKKTRKH